ncbi:MAG: helicase UvrD [Firmicutes bacterium]|nr:helicase UvrD [Bacillota bacterium]
MTLPCAPDAFDRARIAAHAQNLGLTLSHPDQLAFLESTASLDLQAAPGSGKTTLLALKLCLLAQTWHASLQGVCVLSHTNTAKDQIISRLKMQPAGRVLLQYPHFIGTIQSFVNSFFALPYLRSRNCEIQFIDDDQYALAALDLLQKSNQFITLRYFLEKRRGGEELTQTAHFVFDETGLQVKAHKDLPFGPHTPSGKQFIGLKRELGRRGYFRYADMFAFAAKYLSENPKLAESSRCRFPFVLLDEMQDTSQVQEDLITHLFPSNISVVQRVGDINQRIFSDSDGDGSSRDFPNAQAMDLPVSQRFGTKIAEAATSLTAHRPQEIIGDGPEGVCALLIFDREAVHRVVPEFERLVAEIVPADMLAAAPPKVLGCRKVPGTSKDKFPQSLACYLPDVSFLGKPGASRDFISTARRAQVLWSAYGSSSEAVSLLWDGACITLGRLGFKINERRPTKSRVKYLLDNENRPLGIQLREFFLFLLSADLNDRAAWEYDMIGFTSLLHNISGQDTEKESLLDFLDFSSSNESDAVQQAETPAAGNEPAMRIAQASSIHNAKGETHSATLILECLERTGHKYDVHESLKIIRAGSIPLKTPKTARSAAQLVFVGATRPTHMLAMAILRERAEEHVDELRAKGWQIHYVTHPESQGES